MLSKIILLVGISVTSALAASQQCDPKTVDGCVKDILPYSIDSKMSLTEEEIAKDCRQAVKSLECLKASSSPECVKSGLAQGVFKLMIEGAETESNQRCDPAHPRHQEYLKYVPCLNTVGDKLRACQRKATGQFEAITKMPVNERVPTACCAFTRLDQCLRQVAEKNCSKEHATYVSSIVHGVSEAVSDTVCTRYRSNTCSKLASLRVKSKTNYATLVTPIVEILDV